jgi:pantetheine-phosphate adenylyltransferase
MARRFATVAVGGTFDRFHRGHEAILGAAFEVGERVLIGVTSDAMARGKGGLERVERLGARKRAVEAFLRGRGLGHRADVMVLDEPAGPTATDPAIEAIVVSPETEPTARAINAERVRRGLPPMRVVTIEFVLADDEVRISSTRIRDGEIDREGRLLRSAGHPIGSA